MGSYDGAEVCELVGTYLLSHVTQIVDKADIGLYRDDGLSVMWNVGKPEVERRKKRIIQIFKDHGLNLTIRAHLNAAEFLDVEFNLKDELYRPFRKPNSDILYINANSNHPPNVLKQVPESVARRLSDISSSAEIFKQATPAYVSALRNSGFDTELSYTPKECSPQQTKRKRRRNITWYNPPYSMNVKTNVGKEFLRLLRVHFHPNHRLHCIFNTKKVKVSYCCMRNISSIISAHNKYILGKEAPETESRLCNCRNTDECPMEGNCLSPNIVYNGDVVNKTDNEVRPYVGLTSGPFKDRYGVHKYGLRNRKFANSCEFTKHVWSLKDNSKEYCINWSILEHVKGRLVGGECKLCVTEKLHILSHKNQAGLLNSNRDMKCMHKRKFKLARFGVQDRGGKKQRDEPGDRNAVT